MFQLLNTLFDVVNLMKISSLLSKMGDRWVSSVNCLFVCPYEILIGFIVQRRRFWKTPQVSGFDPVQFLFHESYRSVVFCSLN
jgi:hypothetical protein